MSGNLLKCQSDLCIILQSWYNSGEFEKLRLFVFISSNRILQKMQIFSPEEYSHQEKQFHTQAARKYICVISTCRNVMVYFFLLHVFYTMKDLCNVKLANQTGHVTIPLTHQSKTTPNASLNIIFRFPFYRHPHHVREINQIGHESKWEGRCAMEKKKHKIISRTIQVSSSSKNVVRVRDAL